MTDVDLLQSLLPGLIPHPSARFHETSKSLQVKKQTNMIEHFQIYF